MAQSTLEFSFWYLDIDGDGNFDVESMNAIISGNFPLEVGEKALVFNRKEVFYEGTDGQGGALFRDSDNSLLYVNESAILKPGDPVPQAQDQNLNADGSFSGGSGGSGGTKTINGTNGNDVLTGTGAREKIKGKGGNDEIDGRGGDDNLNGGDGKDSLIGGKDKDVLVGGAGKDFFIYSNANHTKTNTFDTINDLGVGADKIDLSAIDANSKKNKNQAFSFIKDQKFSGVAGELRYQQVNAGVKIFGDLNGNEQANFAILAKGINAVQKADFIL